MSIATSFANYSPDWWTPPEWKEWIAATLRVHSFHGEVFDPCPHDWQGEDEDPSGLEIDWLGPCYVNHPGDRNGAHKLWWQKYQHEQMRHRGRMDFIWCAFNCEQLRHLKPSPFKQPGWLVLPDDRTGFVWGGPDRLDKDGNVKLKHGERGKSPGNWTVFWTTTPPATLPGPGEIVPTGR